VLVPFGGAGPLHAAHIAADLALDTIVVPPAAGVISAYGLIASDFMQFDSVTRRRTVDDDAGGFVREVFAEMKERAVQRAHELGLGKRLQLSFVADMRFVGQAFEVPVELAEKDVAKLTAGKIRARFGEAHQRVYFFGGEADKPIEFVSFRLGITVPLRELPLLAEESGQALKAQPIEMFDDRVWRKGQLLSRSALKVGKQVAGPALLEDPTSTLLVPSGWAASRDKNDNTILRRKS
jgi:N-methylhydantoinase A